jgi:hypothetical protein
MFNTTYWKFIDRSWKRNRNGNSLNFLVILGYAKLSYFGGDPTHLDHSPKSTKDEQDVEMKIVKSECAEPVPQYHSGHKVTSDTTGIFGEAPGKVQKNEASGTKPNINKS